MGAHTFVIETLMHWYVIVDNLDDMCFLVIVARLHVRITGVILTHAVVAFFDNFTFGALVF